MESGKENRTIRYTIRLTESEARQLQQMIGYTLHVNSR